MSPHTALESETFLSYVWIAFIVLGIAGMAIAFLRWGLKKNVTPLWVTYRSWLVMAPILLGCIFAGRIPSIVLFCLLAGLGFKEFARATGLYQDWWATISVYLGIAAVGVACIIPQPQGEEDGTGWYGLFISMPVFVIAWIVLIPIIRNRVAGQLQSLSLAIVGFVYMGWMFGHLAFMTNAVNAYGYLLYVVFATAVNDVAAFSFGKILGKRPLRSNISPKKTWGGALGALAVAMALPWTLRFSFPEFGTVELLLTGLIVGVGGQLGDLAISVLKRDIGIKDMGNSIPGHGGILDRIDSLIYVAPLFFHMAGYFHGIK